MNIIIKCQECGESLKVTSVVPKINNIGDLEAVNYTVRPCLVCEKSAYIKGSNDCHEAMKEQQQ